MTQRTDEKLLSDRREYASRSPAHAEKMFKACQAQIKYLRLEREQTERLLKQQLDGLNAVKEIFYREGWELPQ